MSVQYVRMARIAGARAVDSVVALVIEQAEIKRLVQSAAQLFHPDHVRVIDAVAVVQPADHVAAYRVELLPLCAPANPSRLKPLAFIILAAGIQLRRLAP